MRPHKIYWLLVFIAIIFSCNKKPFDYRNKYIGEWNFKVERTEVNTDSIGYYYHDTISYFGKIKYGEQEDELLFEYTADNSITLKIDKEDELSKFPTHYCGGTFYGSEKVHLYLRWGGLGGGVTHVIDGEKD